jgi:hypothetical protein
MGIGLAWDAAIAGCAIRAASRFAQFLRNAFEHLPRIKTAPLYFPIVREWRGPNEKEQ